MFPDFSKLGDLAGKLEEAAISTKALAEMNVGILQDIRQGQEETNRLLQEILQCLKPKQ